MKRPASRAIAVTAVGELDPAPIVLWLRTRLNGRQDPPATALQVNAPGDAAERQAPAVDPEQPS